MAIDLNVDMHAIAVRNEQIKAETDQQILDKLIARFNNLDDMTHAVKQGDVRALIVQGPPGVGKTFGVRRILARDGMMDILKHGGPRHQIVMGAASSLGLYIKFHEFKEKGNVVVFDDCDSILYEDRSLQLLKGALDSSAQRHLSWNYDSNALRREDIPNEFEYKGSAIIITNVKFDLVRSKKLRAHLRAIEDRCHSLDLGMDTIREKMLWVRYRSKEDMLQSYSEEEKTQILDFMEENQDNLTDISLRMLNKIADHYKLWPQNWKDKAAMSCMVRLRR